VLLNSSSSDSIALPLVSEVPEYNQHTRSDHPQAGQCGYHVVRPFRARAAGHATAYSRGPAISMCRLNEFFADITPQRWAAGQGLCGAWAAPASSSMAVPNTSANFGRVDAIKGSPIARRSWSHRQRAALDQRGAAGTGGGATSTTSRRDISARYFRGVRLGHRPSVLWRSFTQSNAAQLVPQISYQLSRTARQMSRYVSTGGGFGLPALRFAARGTEIKLSGKRLHAVGCSRCLSDRMENESCLEPRTEPQRAENARRT